MLAPIRHISEVFKTKGQPIVTYVKREGGEYEKTLSAAIDDRGTLCVLTGPSKTGKTTLYRRVAADKRLELLRLRCDGDLTPSAFWKRALELIDFERVKSTQAGVETGYSAGSEVEGGWSWLARLTGKANFGYSRQRSEQEHRERILAEPSADHLIPILSKLPFLLVVEDFHYLRQQTQVTIFQQWKNFVDSEVSVVIVETTHRAADLARANPDLVGRSRQIEVPSWEKSDLQRIADKGFDFLGIPVPRPTREAIAKESVGLPLIAQSICLQCLLDKGLGPVPVHQRIAISTDDAHKAMHEVAVGHFAQFESMVNEWIESATPGARAIYELLLSAFTLDPISFSLSRGELDHRLARLPPTGKKVPAPAIVTRALNRLDQSKRNSAFPFLEWHLGKLYILEPAFLFFLRFRVQRSGTPVRAELLKELKRIFAAQMSQTEEGTN